MKQGKVRPISIGILRRGNSILAHRGYDPVKQQTFYRPLGGMIEFGETAAQALAREFMEEIGEEVVNPCYLFTVENLFVCNGKPGHEIVLIFQAEFANPAAYEASSFPLVEDDGSSWEAVWIDPFGLPPETPLYPDGLLEYLANHP
jgi:8-oxo-dGTP pyrophosphatase MutT (NUDIX family)